MLEVIKPLLDSDLVNDETRKQISEAWDKKLSEVKEEVRAELREEFAGRYEHDKQTMVEALDKMVTENLAQEIEQVVAEKKALAEDRVKYNAKMSEAAEKFNSFLVKKLAEEINELRSDRKSQAVTMEKLEKFVIENLASEITEFHKDKKDVIETKVKLVSEKIKIPVFLWDERLSTVGAFNLSSQLDVNVTKRVKNIDENAATFILQGVLDYLNN